MKYSFHLVTLFVFFLTLIQAVAQSPIVVRGPYLQVVTPTSVVVRWRTDQPTTGRVWFGASENQLTRDMRESEAKLEHSLTLTGLQPATKYAYAIGYDDTKLASGSDYYVKTAVPAGDTRPLRFWVLGDFGSNNDNQKNVYQAYRNATATRPADLWVWLGDNAYSFGLEQEYQDYVFSVYPPTLRNTPIFMTPGNHDYADSRTNFNIPYYQLFSFPEKGEAGGIPSNTKSYYSADYGNVHLISLDSQANQPEDGFRIYDTTSTQIQWLKRDLVANKLPWKVVIFHHPPYSKGGHDSDTEEQMKLIRENLTPILERYGVDLVLNGHSHGYERTYRMKGMTGLAKTFDKSRHVVESTSGRYDGSPNSCPILTKGEGTVYVINGSGGQIGGQSVDFPHPGTVYNNVTLGGSMILDVNDNRLDAQFLMADGSIQDKFTIVKNANKITVQKAEYGDELQLTASWPGTSASGDYRWSGGQTSRSIRYVVDKAGTFPIVVKDDRNCLVDEFRLTVPQPRISAKTSTSACGGNTLNVTATLENLTKATDWQYDVLISNAAGDFASEQLVGSGKLTELKAVMPANLPAGSSYRLRVRPRDRPNIDLIASEPIVLKALPTATLSGSTTIAQGESASLTLTFTGDGPWKGTLSDGTPFAGATTPLTVAVKPTQSVSYSITNLENGCGKGTASGQASVTVQQALKVTAQTSTSACVGTSIPVTITFDNTTPSADVVYDVLLSDASGNFTKEQIVGSGKSNELKATIPMDLPSSTGYRLQVRPRGIQFVQLIASGGIAVKPLPTATLVGSTTITQGESMSLAIAFTGDSPWKGSLSDGTVFSATGNPTVLSLKPTKSMVYSVSSIENGCGKGTTSGQASVTVLIPTGEEDFAGGQLRIYPNPAHDVVHVELTINQKKEVSLMLFDLQGRSVFQKQAGQVVTLSESIPMPPIHGTYLLKVKVGEYTLTRKVVRQ
ncbi:metallophosphoesterase [Spirosoma validum]|uniref:Metallophosphoesterase n=1 Tax=Spirosoma validum TaxID=2771355 RepID=A0A927B9G2_9BACT|nr:metallophosphoesterase [Spirosoma validum]MBD2757814.1 metallophosphoesterase [Spirosoma validum]